MWDIKGQKIGFGKDDGKELKAFNRIVKVMVTPSSMNRTRGTQKLSSNSWGWRARKGVGTPGDDTLKRCTVGKWECVKEKPKRFIVSGTEAPKWATVTRRVTTDEDTGALKWWKKTVATNKTIGREDYRWK